MSALRPFGGNAGAGHLERSEGTAWMAMYCLTVLEVALILAGHDTTYEGVATRFGA